MQFTNLFGENSNLIVFGNQDFINLLAPKDIPAGYEWTGEYRLPQASGEIVWMQEDGVAWEVFNPQNFSKAYFILRSVPTPTTTLAPTEDDGLVGDPGDENDNYTEDDEAPNVPASKFAKLLRTSSLNRALDQEIYGLLLEHGVLAILDSLSVAFFNKSDTSKGWLKMTFGQTDAQICALTRRLARRYENEEKQFGTHTGRP